MNIDEELEELIRLRDYATKRIRELKSTKRLVANNKQGSSEEYVRKHLWVQTSCITPHVKKELEKGTTLEGLAQRAGVAYRTIANLRDGTNQWTREDIADKVMMAMDLPHIHLEAVTVKRGVPEPPPSKYYED